MDIFSALVSTGNFSALLASSSCSLGGMDIFSALVFSALPPFDLTFTVTLPTNFSALLEDSLPFDLTFTVTPPTNFSALLEDSSLPILPALVSSAGSFSALPTVPLLMGSSFSALAVDSESDFCDFASWPFLNTLASLLDLALWSGMLIFLCDLLIIFSALASKSISSSLFAILADLANAP